MNNPVLIGTLFLWLCSFSIVEAQHVNPEEKPLSPWLLELETSLSHDENIFQVNRDPTSDQIWTASFSVAYQIGSQTLRALALADRYAKNPALNTAYLELGLSSNLSSDLFAEMIFHHTPTALLDKTDAGRTPFELTSSGFVFFIEKELDRQAALGLSFDYTQLNYSEDPKDSRILSIAPSLYLPISDNFDLSGTLRFERSQARAGRIKITFERCRNFRRSIATCRRGLVQNDDISYRAEEFSLQGRYHISRQMHVSLAYRYRNKKFTTPLPSRLEPLHAGRRDRSRKIKLSHELALRKNVHLKTSISQQEVHSTDEDLDFKSRVYEVSMLFLW